MSRRTSLVITVLFCSTILLSCSDRSRSSGDFQSPGVSSINGSELWKQIAEDGDYTDWAEWPGHEGLNPGQSPHGSSHQIFISDQLFNALPVENSTAPDGTVIVKDNYRANGELASITVMAKTVGYAPDTGDWFWAAYNPDGSVRTEGLPAGCLSCHEGMSDNDYIIIRRLDAKTQSK